MRQLVLSKTFGAYSGGTRVTLHEQANGKVKMPTATTVEVRVQTGRLNQTKQLKNYIKNEVIEVPVDILVELRPRTR